MKKILPLSKILFFSNRREVMGSILYHASIYVSTFAHFSNWSKTENSKHVNLNGINCTYSLTLKRREALSMIFLLSRRQVT